MKVYRFVRVEPKVLGLEGPLFMVLVGIVLGAIFILFLNFTFWSFLFVLVVSFGALFALKLFAGYDFDEHVKTIPSVIINASRYAKKKSHKSK